MDEMCRVLAQKAFMQWFFDIALKNIEW